MVSFTFIGYVAAVCTTAAFIPQVYRSLTIKHTEDISLSMYLLFVAGVFLWLSYGVLIKDPPIIIANAITFILALTVLVLKIKHG